MAKARRLAMQTGNEIPDWRITGDWWDLCNCAIGCPCNFGSDPTYGFCEGVLTWLIRDGHYGDLNFTKDLVVVLISHWEGNVMEKNREFGFLIDDRANSAERDALERIFTGYPLHRRCRASHRSAHYDVMPSGRAATPAVAGARRRPRADRSCPARACNLRARPAKAAECRS